MEKNNDVLLLEILVEARLALAFIDKMTKEEFIDDARTNHAVVRCIEIIGEAVKRISLEFQAAHPSIDWSGWARMRDKVIHQYAKVNLKTVWDTMQADIPPLIAFITPLIPPNPNPPDNPPTKDNPS